MTTWKKIKQHKKLWQKYFIREKIIYHIREFFQQHKFHEVQTPLLVDSLIPESYYNYFSTTLLTRQQKKHLLYLTPSPEASLKKLLVAGLGNCFEITRSFRNGETDSRIHNPEFTILEWYMVNATYLDVMELSEKLFIYILQKLKADNSIYLSSFKHQSLHPHELVYNKVKIDISHPWIRLSVANALEKYANLKFEQLYDQHNSANPFLKELIFKSAVKKNYSLNKDDTWESVFNQIFLNEVEPEIRKFQKPVILYDYPLPLAALARTKFANPFLAERFEIYIGGLELGDCYTELTDWKEQKNRFKQQLHLLKKKNINIKEDTDFLDALKSGLPPCSGLAMGVDRLVMLFTDSLDLSEVILFPIKDNY